MPAHNCCNKTCLVHRFDAAETGAFWSEWETVSGTCEPQYSSGYVDWEWSDKATLTGVKLAGKICWVREIPADARGWRVSVRVVPKGAAGAKIRLGIGGQVVEYKVGANGADRSATVQVTTSPSNVRYLVHDGGDAYGTAWLGGDCAKPITLTAIVDRCGDGTYLIRTDNPYRGRWVANSWGYYDYKRYPLGLSAIKGSPKHDLTIEVDGGAVLIDRIEVTRQRIMGSDSDSVEVTQSCEQQFCSPCSHDPDTWNFNGSPCCFGAFFAWKQPRTYGNGLIQGIRFSRIGVNLWSANVEAQDSEDTALWGQRRRILYHPTLTTDGGTWTFSLKHPSSGNTIFEQTVSLDQAAEFRDAMDSAYFSGETSERDKPAFETIYGRAYLVANLNTSDGDKNYTGASYAPGCLPSRLTCTACQPYQWMQSATVEIPDGWAAGTYVVPISRCQGGVCIPGAFSHNGRTCCLTISIDAYSSALFQVWLGGWFPKPGGTPCDCTTSNTSQEGTQADQNYGATLYEAQGPFDCTQSIDLSYAAGAWQWYTSNTEYQDLGPGSGPPSSLTITPNLAQQV